VSDLRKMNRLQEGLFPKYPVLSHSLAMQGDLDWDKMENLVRSYEHSIFAQRTTGMSGGKTDETAAANFAFGQKLGRNGNRSKQLCRKCNKPGHLAKDCRSGRKGGGDRKYSKGAGGRGDNLVLPTSENRTCYVCGKVGHIARDCRNRTSKATEDLDEGKKRKFAGNPGKNGKPTWYGKAPSSKNRRNYDGEEDSEVGNMFVEMSESDDEASEHLKTMYDDEVVMNLALDEDPFQGEERIIVDSGCNRIAVNKRELFTSLDEKKRRKIKTALRKAILNVEGVGDIRGIENVYYCPQSAENLVGVNYLYSMGYTTVLDDNVTIYDKETDLVMVQYKQINGIYYITLNDLIKLQEFRDERNAQVNAFMEDRDDLKILHERTGHVEK